MATLCSAAGRHGRALARSRLARRASHACAVQSLRDAPRRSVGVRLVAHASIAPLRLVPMCFVVAGDSPARGHYIARVRRPDGQWVEHNDRQVTTLSVRQVYDKQSYVLLYRRMQEGPEAR